MQACSYIAALADQPVLQTLCSDTGTDPACFEREEGTALGKRQAHARIAPLHPTPKAGIEGIRTGGPTPTPNSLLQRYPCIASGTVVQNQRSMLSRHRATSRLFGDDFSRSLTLFSHEPVISDNCVASRALLQRQLRALATANK